MKFLGVDIGGTNIDMVIYDKTFKHFATYPTSEYIEKLNEILKKIIKKEKIDAIGIGAAVWIKNGKIVNAPNLPSIPDFGDVPIILDNDANCFALFAYKTFAFENLLAITIGTGIGSGIIINGKIYRGNGLAGEMGHLFVGGNKKCGCGGIGHLECYFGGKAMKEKYGKEAKELLKDDFIYSTEEFNLFCRVVSNAVALISPLAVVFGGRIGMNLNEERLKEGIYAYLPPFFNPEIKVVKDSLAVAKGACLMAMSKF